MPLALVFLLLIPTLILPEEPVTEPVVSFAVPSMQPRIASDGRNFLIVSSQFQFYSLAHYAMLVDSEGHPLLPVSYDLHGQGDIPDAASSGHNYLVVFGARGGTTGMRIGADGRLLDKSYLVIHKETRPQTLPHDIYGRRAITWNGTEYVVVTQIERIVTTPGLHGESSIAATRVSESGQILENDIELSATGIIDAIAIAGRNGVTVVAAGNVGMRVRTMTAGSLSEWVTISGDRGTPSIAAGDDGFLLAFKNGAKISAQHLDPSGRPDNPLFAVDGVPDAENVSVAWSGSSYVLCWSEPSETLRALHVTGRGDRLDTPFVVGSGIRPVIASNGTTTVVAAERKPIVEAGPVRESGKLQPIHRTYIAQTNPQPIWSGMVPSVSWSDQDLYERRIGDVSPPRKLASSVTLIQSVGGGPDPLHLVVDTSGLTALTASSSVLLERGFTGTARGVWTGSSFIVVWSTFSTSTLFAARLAPDGTLIDGPHQISSQGVGEFAIAASSANVLVAYLHPVTRLTHGVMLTPFGLTRTDDIATPQDLVTSMSIASNGTDFLVTWISANGVHSNDYIAGQIVDADGHLVGQRKILSPGDDWKTHGTTFWTGSEYLIVWSRRSLSADLWAIRVTAEGQLLDYPPVHLGAFEGDITAIARSTSGQLLVAYTRSPRAYTRFVTFPRTRSVRH